MPERAVSTALGFVLLLGIVALLLTGLLFAFGPFVTGQQHDSSHATLTVFAQDLAGDLESADRLAASAGENGTVTLETALPNRVGDQPYTIDIVHRQGPLHELHLRSSDPDTSVSVTVRVTRPVETEPATLSGGPVTISYDGQQDRLVISDG